MNSLSYKQYLSFVANYKKSNPFLRAISASALIAIVFILGIGAVGAGVYLVQTPKIAAKNYLETATASFISTQGSISALLESFQVAGARTQTIDTLKESSQSASGYLISVGDVVKSADTIDVTKRLIGAQQAQIKSLKVPGQYKKVNGNIEEYQQIALSSLNGVEADVKFQKDLLLILGSSFYLPSLSDESIWKEKNNEAIIAYYEKTKLDAQVAQEKLNSLTPPPKYEKYYALQKLYLEKLLQVSDNILKILKEGEDQNLENASQIEKAYQVLVGARRENEQLSGDLLTEKLKLFATKTNLEKLADVRLREDSIKQELEQLATTLPAPLQIKIPAYFNKYIEQK